LFEFGDAKAVGVGNAIGLEDGVESVEDGGLPVGDEVRLDAVLAAEFGLTGVAAQQLQDDLRFELSRKGSTGTRHDSDSWSGPVTYRLLVQRQGRSSKIAPTLDPKEIDIGDKGEIKGIYAIEGDTLKVMHIIAKRGQPTPKLDRPKKFTPKAGDGYVYMELKRVKQ
jgi:hypothetical protein